MPNEYFEYIDDNVFINGVKKLVKDYVNLSEGFTNNDLFKNKLDPFHILIQGTIAGQTAEEYLDKNEKSRQISRTLSNWVGSFHEANISHLSGFEKVPQNETTKKGVTQLDVINEKLKIVAEIKNKWNTVKGSDKSSIFNALKAYVENGYIGYYVKINDKISKIDVWEFVEKEVYYSNENIYECSIDQFLLIATGDKNAFSKYIKGFQKAIKDSLKTIKNLTISEETMEEFNKLIFEKNYETYL